MRKLDLVFVRNALDQPWHASTAQASENWAKQWVPKDLPGVDVRIHEAQYRLEDWEWTSALPLFERCLSTMQDLVHRLLSSPEDDDRCIVLCSWALDGLFAKLLYILAHLDYPELAERIVGLVFFSVPHDAPTLAHYVNVIEAIANPTPPRADLRASAPYLLGLNHTFASLVTPTSLPCLSFGSMPYAQHPSLRQLELVEALGFGTHHSSTTRDLFTMTKFSTREAIEYQQFIAFLREVAMPPPQPLCLPDETSGKKTASLSFFVLVKRPHMFLYAPAEDSEPNVTECVGEKLFASPRDTSKTGWKLIHELSVSSLFSAMHEVLREMEGRWKASGGEGEAAKAVKEGGVRMELCGSQRETELMYAFTCMTLGLQKDKQVDETGGIAKVPLPSSVARVPYDLAYDPPQVRVVKEQMEQLRAILASSVPVGGGEVEEMLRKMEEFVERKIRIAVVGRPNAGKSTFLNALLKRNILPHSEKTCTGSQLQIIGCDSKEEEHVEIEYMAEKAFGDLTTELRSRLENVEQKIEVYEEPEFRYQYAEQVKSLKAQLAREKSFLEDVEATYAAAIGEGGHIQTKKPTREESLEQILSQTAINVSKASCTLINTVRLHLHAPILRYVTLVDTPGKGEDPLRDRRVLEAVQQADGWIYLTNFDSHDAHVVEDVSVFQAEARNAQGLIVITKFDVHVHDSTAVQGDPSLDRYVQDKRMEIQAVTFDSSLPAISCRLLLDVTSTPKVRLRKGAKHTAEQLEMLLAEEQAAEVAHRRIRTLSRLHVGRFLYESEVEEGGEQQQSQVDVMSDDGSDYDEEDDEDGDVEAGPSYAELLAASSGGVKARTSNLAAYGPSSVAKKRKFLQDAAMECSMLLPMMDDVYDMANRHIVVRDFGLLLSTLKDYLYTHMEQIDALLNSTNFDLQVVTGQAQCDRQLLAQRQNAKKMSSTLEACKEAYEDMEKACLEREERIQGEIVLLAKGIAAVKLSNVKQTYLEEQSSSIISSRLSRHTFTVRLHDCVTMAVSDMANKAVRDVLSSAAIESLLHPEFRPIKQHVLVSVECATAKLHAMQEGSGEATLQLDDVVDLVTFQQKKRGLKAFKQALDEFVAVAMRAAALNSKQIAGNVRQQLSQVHGAIFSLVQKFILQQEKKLHTLLKTIQQRELQTLPRPVDLLLISKELLSRERHQVTNLHSHVLNLLLDNQMKEQRSRKGLLKTKTKLSKAEEGYLRLVAALFVGENYDQVAKTVVEDVSMVSPDISLAVVRSTLSQLSGVALERMSREQLAELPPSSFIMVEKRRIVALVHGSASGGKRAWEELGVVVSSGIAQGQAEAGSAPAVSRFQRTHEELTEYCERNLCSLLCEKR